MDATPGDGRVDADPVAGRLAVVRSAVVDAERAAGRPEGSVRILLATKTVEPARILAALRAGARLIGENRVQEVVAKAEDLDAEPHESHFIGHLQRNKITALLPHISCIQTIDSIELARAVDRRLAALERELDVFLQVNVTGEASKAGIAPDGAADLLAAVASLDSLRPRGWMTIGLPSPDRGAVRAGYARLSELQEATVADGVPGADDARELSMGMSGDFPDAIAEGATIVRVGSAVFGARPAAATGHGGSRAGTEPGADRNQRETEELEQRERPRSMPAAPTAAG